MSTRAEQRAAIVAKVKLALPSATLISDPDAQRLARERPGGLIVQIARGRRVIELSQEFGSVHQEAPEQVWYIFFLIPTQGSPNVTTEDVADDVFEKLYDELCPAAGWRPATDCDVMNCIEEDWSGRTGQGDVYYAVYTHGVLIQ